MAVLYVITALVSGAVFLVMLVPLVGWWSVIAVPAATSLAVLVVAQVSATSRSEEAREPARVDDLVAALRSVLQSGETTDQSPKAAKRMR